MAEEKTPQEKEQADAQPSESAAKEGAAAEPVQQPPVSSKEEMSPGNDLKKDAGVASESPAEQPSDEVHRQTPDQEVAATQAASGGSSDSNPADEQKEEQTQEQTQEQPTSPQPDVSKSGQIPIQIDLETNATPDGNDAQGPESQIPLKTVKASPRTILDELDKNSMEAPADKSEKDLSQEKEISSQEQEYVKETDVAQQLVSDAMQRLDNLLKKIKGKPSDL